MGVKFDMKKIILLIIMFIPSIVLARSKTSCDYTLLSNLKNLASNVDITYTYRIENDIAFFNVSITNLSSDMYIVDNYKNRTYYYEDTNNGIITINDYLSGNISYSIYSNNIDCLNEKLTVKYVNLPYYNKYYKYDECSGIEEFNLCQKWVKYDGFYDDFIDKTNEYRLSLNKNINSDNNVNDSFFTKLMHFYLKYYYLIIPLFILLIIGILYLIKYIKNRLNRFKI